ncbi:MAG: hypothetical protein WBD02_10585 [Acidimicrobiia bacterium]
MQTLRAVLEGIIGGGLILLVLDSTIRTFLIPRGLAQPLTRLVFLAVRAVFQVPVRLAKTYEARDRRMAWYGPLGLLILPMVWLVLVWVGYALLFHIAVKGIGFPRALEASGSSLLTLGFVRPSTAIGLTLAFSEAALGLALLALLIAYLPTIYSAFSRRETSVGMLSYRAGTPPSAVDLLVRANQIGLLDNMDTIWIEWQQWFAELEETHTSLAVLSFFRSPNPHRSWITAAGTVLDAASLHLSAIDVPTQPMAGLCVRSGFISLRAIAEFFGIDFDRDPTPNTPITIAREEFDEVLKQLEAAGVPLKPDRDQAWRDFSGWRVNYDAVVVGLAALVVAPYCLWVSDRSIRVRRPRMLRRRG